jgi:hypothetical protein
MANADLPGGSVPVSLRARLSKIGQEVREMKMRPLLLTSLLMLFSSGAMALCQVGTTASCTINGKPGKKECLGAGFGPCEPTGSVPPPATGTVTLKYKVLTVLYAPPGTNGGMSTSQVSYSSGSTTGSTTTSTSSFKSDYSVSASLGIGDPSKKGASLGGSFEITDTQTQSDALDIKKAVTKTLLVTGPSTDGIDHDRDEIWLWLKPVVDISVAGNAVDWSFADTSQGFTQFYYAGWLKNPSTMPAAQLQALQSSGITPADYAEILKADPLAGCAQLVIARVKTAVRPIGPILPCNTPQPSGPRYVFLQQWFPYEPPYAQGDPNTTVQLKFDNSLVNTSTSTAEVDYKLGASAGGSFGLGPITVSLKTDDSWTWADTDAKASSAGTTQSVFATVGGPAFGYKGPYNMMELYLDTVYQTFAFVPIAGPTDALRGVITTSSGKPSVGTPVTAIVGGKRYLTYTDSKGEYRFGRKFVGVVKVVTGSVQQNLQKIDPAKSIDFKLE